MVEKLTFKYYCEVDILYVNNVPLCAEQESEELEDEIIVRMDPKTGKVKNFEVLFFTSRLLRSELFSLPVIADLRQATAE